MTPPNVRRISGSSNPNDLSYTGLGHVDREGVYHFPDGRTLPTTGGVDYPDGRHLHGGMTLVVSENASTSGTPTPDAANPTWSALQRLHCVDAARQDAYDLAEFGEIGGDPVVEPLVSAEILPPSNPGNFNPHSPEVVAYEVDSPARNAAVAVSRKTHPERHQGIDPYATTTSQEN